MPGTVLCVDNDRDLVQILSKALQTEGYRVLSAYDGDQAVQVATREAPDLVLLDLILPKRDGFSVLEAIRTQEGSGAATPVVLLTGCTPTPEYQKRSSSLGAKALLTKPLPLDELLGVVSRHISRPDAAAPRNGKGAEELSGSLESLPFPALFHHLHGLRAKGVLHLENGRRRKWIEFRDGQAVAVRSNLVSECLGNYLMRTKRITESTMNESRRRMRAGRLQGEILVAMDVLREEEVPTVLRQQAEEKLFEIFTWRSGAFRFELGARLQRANELPVDTSPANLILRGVRERLPLERVEHYLRANADATVARARSPFYRFQEIDLTPEQLALIRSLDSGRRLAGFLDADEELRRTLYALLSSGMLELRGGEPPGPPSGADAASPRPEPKPRSRAREAELRAELTLLAQRVRASEPFEVLGVAPRASDAEIRGAYEDLVSRVHPDRLAGASPAVARLADEIQRRVARAFETLIDPRRRADYLLERKRRERRASQRKDPRSNLDAELQFQSGEAALRQRDYKKAVVCFRRAVELATDVGEYHAHHGWALHLAHPDDEQKLKAAIGHVRHGLKLARDSEKPYLFMGRLLKAAGRMDVAEKMFGRAAQIQPECVEALRELRLLRMRREKSKGLVRRLLRR